MTFEVLVQGVGSVKLKHCYRETVAVPYACFITFYTFMISVLTVHK